MKFPLRLDLAVILCFLLVPGRGMGAARKVNLVNTVDEPFEVWFKTQHSPQWVKPPLYITRKGDVQVNLFAAGQYYLVIRDSARRDTYIGWIDFHAIAAVPKAEVIIAQFIVTETQAYDVMVTVYQEETRVDRFGMRYRVRVPVQRVEKRTATVKLMKTQLKVRIAGKVQTLEEFFRPKKGAKK